MPGRRDSSRRRGDGARQGGESELAHAADTFQVLASTTRLRILRVLAEQELCVGDLAAAAGSTESAVSHHLRQLRQMRIVKARREGRLIYYRLDDDHIAQLLEIGLAHVRERLG